MTYFKHILNSIFSHSQPLLLISYIMTKESLRSHDRSAANDVRMTSRSADFGQNKVAQESRVKVVNSQESKSLLTLAHIGGGGGLMHPHEFFWNGRRTAGRIALKFCTAYKTSFAQLLAKKIDQVRSPSYDVIRGTPLCILCGSI